MPVRQTQGWLRVILRRTKEPKGLNEKNSAKAEFFLIFTFSRLIPSRRSCRRLQVLPERVPVREPVPGQVQAQVQEPVPVPGRVQAQVQEPVPVLGRVQARVRGPVPVQERVRARVPGPVHYKY